MKSKTSIFNLHELIRSLKKEEKRHFKIQAKKYSQKDNVYYLGVFDYLNSLDVVHPAQFKKKFKQVKGLSGVQAYLYDQILKSLRIQNANKNIDIQLAEGYIDLQVLYSKDLFSATQRRLLELLQLAELHDKIFFLPIFYEWWLKLENIHFRFSNVDDERLDEYIEKYQQSVNTLGQYQTLRIQMGRLLYKVKTRNSKQALDFVKEMEKTLPSYQPNQKKLSTAIAELQLRKYLASIARNNKATYYYSKEIYILLKQQPKVVFHSYCNSYFSTLLTLMHTAPSLEKAVVLQKEINSTDWHQLMFSHTKNGSYLAGNINGFLLTGALKECRQFIQKCLEEQNSIDNFTFGFLYYKIAVCYYACGDYDLALQLIDEHLEGKKSNPVHRNVSALLKIIIYYEQAEYSMLAYFLSNLRRRLRETGVLFKLEEQFISFMTELVNLPHSEHPSSILYFREKIVVELAELSNPEKEILTHLNLIGWLDSRIDKKPFTRYFFWNVEHIVFNRKL